MMKPNLYGPKGFESPFPAIQDIFNFNIADISNLRSGETYKGVSEREYKGAVQRHPLQAQVTAIAKAVGSGVTLGAMEDKESEWLKEIYPKTFWATKLLAELPPLTIISSLVAPAGVGVISRMAGKEGAKSLPKLVSFLDSAITGAGTGAIYGGGLALGKAIAHDEMPEPKEVLGEAGKTALTFGAFDIGMRAVSPVLKKWWVGGKPPPDTFSRENLLAEAYLQSGLSRVKNPELRKGQIVQEVLLGKVTGVEPKIKSGKKVPWVSQADDAIKHLKRLEASKEGVYFQSSGINVPLEAEEAAKLFTDDILLQWFETSKVPAKGMLKGLAVKTGGIQWETLKKLRKEAGEELYAKTKEEFGIKTMAASPRKQMFIMTKTLKRHIAGYGEYFEPSEHIFGRFYTPLWNILRKTGMNEDYNLVKNSILDYRDAVQQLKIAVHQVHEGDIRSALKKKGIKYTKKLQNKFTEYVEFGEFKDEIIPEVKYILDGPLRKLQKALAKHAGIPEEFLRKNYVRHVVKAAEKFGFSDEMLKGIKDPRLKIEIFKQMRNKIPGAVYVPMREQRMDKIPFDLLERNYFKLLDSYIDIAMKYKYLDPMLKELKTRSRNWSPKIKTLMEDWVNYQVLEKPTKIDAVFNEMLDIPFRALKAMGVAETGLTGRTVSSTVRMATYAGTMGMNYAVTAKNLSQLLLIPGFVDSKSFLKGTIEYFTSDGQKLLKEMTKRGYSEMLRGRLPYEPFDPSKSELVRKAFTVMMYSYKKVDQFIVGVAFLSGMIKKYGSAGGALKNIKSKGFMDAVAFADNIAKFSQYSYQNFDMPMLYSGSVGKMAGQLQSWWMNYFTNYLPELLIRLGGKDSSGNKVTMSERLGLLRYLTYAYGVSYGMKKAFNVDLSSTFLTGVIPQKIPSNPTIEVIKSLWDTMQAYAGADEERFDDGLKRLDRAAKTSLVPMGAEYKKIKDAIQMWKTGYAQDIRGRYQYPVSKKEALMKPFIYTETARQYREKMKEAQTVQYRYKRNVRKAIDLMVKGDYKKAQEFMAKHNVYLTNEQIRTGFEMAVTPAPLRVLRTTPKVIRPEITEILFGGK